MDPFQKYLQDTIAAARHCPVGRCAVCASQPTLVRLQFADLVGRSWSPAEIDLLSKAAQSALL
jgi:hypothetical protein